MHPSNKTMKWDRLWLWCCFIYNDKDRRQPWRKWNIDFNRHLELTMKRKWKLRTGIFNNLVWWFFRSRAGYWMASSRRLCLQGGQWHALDLWTTIHMVTGSMFLQCCVDRNVPIQSENKSSFQHEHFGVSYLFPSHISQIRGKIRLW